MVLMDEAIMNMITLETSAFPQLRNCLKESEECSLANALLALELLRNPPCINSTVDASSGTKNTTSDEIRSCLSRLEQQIASLNDREKYLASAAFCWSMGNYSKAGALLESCLALNPGDVIALRLAQDVYLASGDSRNVLGCITRCLQILDDNHFLHGHMMGMLAVGFVENGRIIEAEETAARAVTRTKGRDLWALHSLLNTFQLTGRSSEILASLDEHEERHEGSGLLFLLFNKGSALVQRANYRGAIRIYDMMIDHMELKEENCVASSVMNATLLLWQIGLNATDDSVNERWRAASLTNLWNAIELKHGMHSPLLDLGKLMTLAAVRSKQETWLPLEPHETTPNETIVKNQARSSTSLWGWMTSQGSPASSILGAGKTMTPSAAKRAAAAEKAKIFLSDPKKLFEEHVRLMELYKEQDILVPNEGVVVRKASFPNLASVEPTFPFETRSPEAVSFVEHGKRGSERTWTMHSCTAHVGSGLSLFNNADYVQAVDAFKNFIPILHRVGGTAVQRDLIYQTIIEAYLRSDKLVESRLLLCDRASLAPNDAQAWRRLASVFGRLGQKELAEVAHYTAWQLGIGQGGFIRSGLGGI